jgi:hypothetical protein
MQLVDPQMLAIQFCPAVQASLDSLVPVIQHPADQVRLKTIADLNAKFCASSASVNTADVQTMANEYLPGLISMVQASPLPADKQALTVAALTGANLVLNTALNAAKMQAAASASVIGKTADLPPVSGATPADGAHP